MMLAEDGGTAQAAQVAQEERDAAARLVQLEREAAKKAQEERQQRIAAEMKAEEHSVASLK